MSPVANDIADVDVIIAVRASGDGLEAAVASAESQVAPGRVVVVDTGGAEAAIRAVAAGHPGVHFIRTDAGGHAAALNAGIAATSGEFVLLLDPDAVIEEHCVRPLVARANSNRAAGVIAPRLTHADGSTWQGSFGPFPAMRQALVERVNLVTHRMSGGRTSLRNEVNGTTPVDWVGTTCTLVRRKAIDAAGPMDETIGAHFDDVDWCQRMRSAGWTVLVEPMATAVYQPLGAGDGSAAGSPSSLAEYRAAFFRYLAKHRLGALAIVARAGLAASRPTFPEG